MTWLPETSGLRVILLKKNVLGNLLWYWFIYITWNNKYFDLITYEPYWYVKTYKYSILNPGQFMENTENIFDWVNLWINLVELHTCVRKQYFL